MFRFGLELAAGQQTNRTQQQINRLLSGHNKRLINLEAIPPDRFTLGWYIRQY